MGVSWITSRILMLKTTTSKTKLDQFFPNNVHEEYRCRDDTFQNRARSALPWWLGIASDVETTPSETSSVDSSMTIGDRLNDVSCGVILVDSVRVGTEVREIPFPWISSISLSTKPVLRRHRFLQQQTTPCARHVVTLNRLQFLHSPWWLRSFSLWPSPASPIYNPAPPLIYF